MPHNRKIEKASNFPTLNRELPPPNKDSRGGIVILNF